MFRRCLSYLLPVALGFSVGLVGFTVTASASAQSSQSITATQAKSCIIAWDQAAPDLATAQAFVYKASVDAAAAVTVPATCSGAASPFACQTPLPVQTVGPHTLSISANVAQSDGTLVTSGPSTAFAFTITADAPPVPINLRLILATAVTPTTPVSTPPVTAQVLSPDCTKGPTITTPDGTWTLGPNGETLLNGTQVGGGTSSGFLYAGGKTYIFGTNGYYQLISNTWTFIGPSVSCAPSFH